MKILGIECSAGPASVAITENGVLLGSNFINVKLTHSQTLMPMVEQTLKNCTLSLVDIDYIAVAAGPGSFTGVRIGISAVKGMAAPLKTPCVSVSTLFAMAQKYVDRDCIVCAVMDARCNQVYNAMFEIKDGNITRLCDDRALLCDELANEIENIYRTQDKPIIITGDGAKLFYPFVENFAQLSPESIVYQNAVGVCLAASTMIEKGQTVTADELLPIYLRLPQAERELKKKEAERN